jgi:hypothetical protein
MVKNWWFQFHFKDWRTDSALHRCSLETRGLWIEVLCVMHETDAAELSGTRNELARLLGVLPEELARCLIELKNTKTANVTECNGIVTLLSRRRNRELSDKEQTRLRVQRHRGNASVTNKVKVISKSKKEEKKKIAAATDQEWLNSLTNNPAYKKLDVMTEFAKAGVWVSANNRSLTRRFFVNWLNRAKPMDVQTNGTNNRFPVKKSNITVLEESERYFREKYGDPEAVPDGGIGDIHVN